MAYGLPYMGSKNKIIKDIVKKILEIKPNTKYIYSLFGGGGAAAHRFSEIGQIEKIYYNEYEPAIAKLIKLLIKEYELPDYFYNWVSRDYYNKYKNNKDVIGGLLWTCWSFGNNIKNGYLYSKSISKFKEKVHNAILNKSDIVIDSKKYSFNYSNNIFDNMLNVRKFFREKYKKTNKEIFYIMSRLEHIERLKRLYDFNQNKYKHKIIVSNKSFEEVNIETKKEETIIYLDPPYQNTAKYIDSFDFDKLYNYIKDMTNKGYTIFLSEYKNHYNLKEVWQKQKRITLSSNDNSKQTTERLFYNNI